MRKVSTARILLVDDEDTILDLLDEILSAEGHNIERAQDGAEALKVVMDDDFDLIITDFRMPVMTGKEFYERAVAARPDLSSRFIFVSGELDPQVKRDFLASTAVRVIAKPFRADRVREAVQEALRNA